MIERITKSADENAQALADSLASLVVAGPADAFELDIEAAYKMILRHFGEFGLDVIDEACSTNPPKEIVDWLLKAGHTFRVMTGRKP